MKRILTRTLAVLLIILVLLILICTLPFPVRRTLDAVLIGRGAVEESERLSVEIRGSYHVNLLSDDVFRGVICMEGFPVTEQEIELTCAGSSRWFSAGMHYHDPVAELPTGSSVYQSVVFGYLFASRSFRELAIEVYGEDGTGYCLIAAPAESDAQAVSLIERLYGIFDVENLKLTA